MIIFDVETGLPLFSKLPKKIDGTLLAGFLTAITQIAKELAMGGISSFIAEEKHIFLSARHHVVVAIIANEVTDTKTLCAMAHEIGVKFEKKYFEILRQRMEIVELEKFKGFETIVDEIIALGQVPFHIEVLDFIKKQFGDRISVRPTLYGRDGNPHVIDIIVEKGKKRGSIYDKLAMRLFRAFSQDLIFINFFEGKAKDEEVLTFIQSLKLFGAKDHELEKRPEIFPYFPSSAVIIAEEYSPAIINTLSAIIPKEKEQFYIGATHLAPTADLKFTPKAARCSIELWKWKENKATRII